MNVFRTFGGKIPRIWMQLFRLNLDANNVLDPDQQHCLINCNGLKEQKIREKEKNPAKMPKTKIKRY